MSYLGNSFSYLLDIGIRLFVLLLLLRVWIQLCHVNFYHQLVQFTCRITDPLVNPLQSLIPKVSSLDLASCVLVFVLSVVRAALVAGSSGYTVEGLFLFGLGLILQQLVGLMMFAIIASAILSWINPNGQVGVFLFALCAFMFDPIRKRIGVISGIDLSPLFALIALGFVSRLFVQPLLDYGLRLMSS